MDKGARKRVEDYRPLAQFFDLMKKEARRRNDRWVRLLKWEDRTVMIVADPGGAVHLLDAPDGVFIQADVFDRSVKRAARLDDIGLGG